METVPRSQCHNHILENTHLLCKGKFHCTADLLFEWFGFARTSKSVVNKVSNGALEKKEMNNHTGPVSKLLSP